MNGCLGIGTGYIALDVFTIGILWLAAGLNCYLALNRINTAFGRVLVARRMVAVGFLGQACNLSYRMYQFGGDLLVSPQAEVLYGMVAVASCILFVDRVKLGRGAVE